MNPDPRDPVAYMLLYQSDKNRENRPGSKSGCGFLLVLIAIVVALVLLPAR